MWNGRLTALPGLQLTGIDLDAEWLPVYHSSSSCQSTCSCQF